MTAMTKSTSVMVFPPKRGFSPVFDVMSARLMSQKRPATPKKRIWMILLFSGGGIETMPRQKITCSGVQEYRVRRFLGEQKRRQCRYPAVSARQTPLFERKSAAPNIVNIITFRHAATGYGTERISERAPAFSARFARLILTNSYRYAIFSLCGALCAACFRCHLKGEEDEKDPKMV